MQVAADLERLRVVSGDVAELHRDLTEELTVITRQAEYLLASSWFRTAARGIDDLHLVWTGEEQLLTAARTLRGEGRRRHSRGHRRTPEAAGPDGDPEKLTKAGEAWTGAATPYRNLTLEQIFDRYWDGKR